MINQKKSYDTSTKGLPNELVAAGVQVLDKNSLPEATKLNLTISNAQTGEDLMLLGLAKGQGKNLANLFSTMDVLETQLFSEEAIEEMDFMQRLELYREAKSSIKFRTDFVRNVRKDVNTVQLQVDMVKEQVKKANKEKQMETAEVRRVIRERIGQNISAEYKMTPTNPVLIDAEVIEGNK